MSCHVMASRAMPGHIFTCHAIFLRVMPCHKYSMPCRVKIFDLGTNKHVFTGGCRPQTPCSSWGASSHPDPWRWACSPPCPPAYREALPLRLSVCFGTKILVPRSWYQNLGSGSWYQVACRVPNLACHAVSTPFVSKKSVSCRVINLRVGVSVPCRGHPGICTVSLGAARVP